MSSPVSTFAPVPVSTPALALDVDRTSCSRGVAVHLSTCLPGGRGGVFTRLFIEKPGVVSKNNVSERVKLWVFTWRSAGWQLC